MKNCMKIKRTCLAACLTLVAHGAVLAQSSIQMVAEPFQTEEVNPFAPPAGSAIANVQVAPVAPIMASVQLEKGVRVDQQLRAYGQKTGWDLVWEGPEYVLDQSIVVQGDFEGSITTFLNGANEAGARLRAVFYRGNKTVRVMEF